MINSRDSLHVTIIKSVLNKYERVSVGVVTGQGKEGFSMSGDHTTVSFYFRLFRGLGLCCTFKEKRS